MIDYDRELRRLQAVFRRAYSIDERDHVLDIGCGSGETTRDAARAAIRGSVIGLDRSEAMIEQARALTHAEGLSHVQYVCADLERHALPPQQLDLAISRFGTMFFTDPSAAFSHIRAALKPRGRLAMLVWQPQDHNEWALALPRAVAGNASIAPSAATEQAFSLGEPSALQQLMHAAGFVDVTLDDVREPVFYGPDSASAFALVSHFDLVQHPLRALPDAAREPARARLRALLASHQSDDGVWFDARAWIVRAHRP
jgi:ubiquinone/menaquinone biosynthesis C-methylase UbiE